MKEIKLTMNQFAIVDDDDYEMVNSLTWCVHKSFRHNEYVYYVRRNSGKDNKTVLLHRFLLGITDRKVHVDHINGNPLDNRRENLRIATNSQNCMNRAKLSTSKSIYKGVSWHKKHKKYTVKIKLNQKNIWIGGFDDEIEAALAYDKKAKELFGEYAWLNFK